MINQSQPTLSASQTLQQLQEIKADHPQAYPAALNHVLDLFGGVEGFMAALKQEQGQGSDQNQAPVPQAAPQPPVQTQPLMPPGMQPTIRQNQPPAAKPPQNPPIKAPPTPLTGFGMSQGPRFTNGAGPGDKIAAGLMAGLPVGQARGNAMAAAPRMASGGTISQPPLGSTPNEVADDIPAHLSQDETVIPADVSKWWGQRTFEAMRNEAKQGFARMARDGRLKSGGGNADGGIQDLTPLVGSEFLQSHGHPMEEPDRDTGASIDYSYADSDKSKSTGFLAGGMATPYYSGNPVTNNQNYATGGPVGLGAPTPIPKIDISANPDTGSIDTTGGTNNVDESNKDITNSGNRTDPNTWGNKSLDPYAGTYNTAKDVFNTAIGMASPVPGVGLGTSLASSAIDTNRQAALNNQTASLGDIVQNALSKSTFGLISPAKFSDNSSSGGVKDEGIGGGDLANPSDTNPTPGNGGFATADSGPYNISDLGQVASINNGVATDAGGGGNGSGNENNGDGGGDVGGSGRDTTGGDATGNGGDANAAKGGFFAAPGTPMKRINKGKMLKAATGGFVRRPEVNVRHITSRTILNPRTIPSETPKPKKPVAPHPTIL